MLSKGGDMPIIINIDDKRWNEYKFDWEKIAKNALNLENKGAEISLTLTNDDEIQRLNLQYRGIDKPTNVLSFETGDSELLGDIFISFDTAMKESPDDFMNHIIHLLVHGILHLQGLDHIRRFQAWRMERREIRILKRLGIENPYKSAKRKARSAISAMEMFLLGVAGVFGFAPWHFFPATMLSIGLAYWLILCRYKKSAFWWGAGYGVAGFYWCLSSIFANEELARQLWYFYPIGLIGIAAGAGIIFGVPFWMTKKTGADGWKRVVYFALAWCFVLWLREWFLTGFPWNPLANIFIDTKLSGGMAVAGALGMSFLTAGAICSVPEFARSRAKWQFLFLAPLLGSFFVPQYVAPETQVGDYRQLLRIVQPNFNMNQKYDDADANLAKLMELSSIPSAPGKAFLIIWPESAYPFLYRAGEKLPALGASLAAGALVKDNGNYYNALLLANQDGNVVDMYEKTHLVPFGEYSPFGPLVPVPMNLTAGQGARELGAGFIPAICYEIIFSDSLFPRIGGNPQFILNITNDAWFGNSSGPYQHLDMARRQAIESGLPVIRAANTGISAIIDANGRIVSSLGLNQQGVLNGVVPNDAHLTIYRRIGLHGVMLIIVLVCFALLRCRRIKS